MNLKYIMMAAAMCLMFESNATSWGNTNTLAFLKNRTRRAFSGSYEQPTVPYGQIRTQVTGYNEAHFKHSQTDSTSLSDLVYVDQDITQYRIINLCATSRKKDDYIFCETNEFKLPFYVDFGNTPISLIGQKIDEPRQYILLVVRSNKDLLDPGNIEKIQLTQADVEAINAKVEAVLSQQQTQTVSLVYGYSLTLELHSTNITGFVSRRAPAQTTTYKNYWIKYSVDKTGQKPSPTLLPGSRSSTTTAQKPVSVLPAEDRTSKRYDDQLVTYTQYRGGYPQTQGQQMDTGTRRGPEEYMRQGAPATFTPSAPATRVVPTQGQAYPQSQVYAAPAPAQKSRMRQDPNTSSRDTSPASRPVLPDQGKARNELPTIMDSASMYETWDLE